MKKAICVVVVLSMILGWVSFQDTKIYAKSQSFITPSEIQMGVVTVGISSGKDHGSKDVNFPIVFSAKPLVFTSLGAVSVGGQIFMAEATNINKTGFRIYAVRNKTASSVSVQVFWLAINPE